MAVWCLFLRAVNVSGTGTLRMDALRAGLEEAGFAGVGTLGASGNAVARLEAEEDAVRARAEAVTTALVGRETPVIVRSPAALEAALRRAEAEEARLEPGESLAVALLSGPVGEDAASRLHSFDGKGDRVLVCGSELLLIFKKGQGRSAITTDRLERLSGRRCTARNLNTMRRVLEKSMA